MDWKAKKHIRFVLILSLALMLRVLCVVFLDPQPVSDFAWYHDRAIELASGHGYSVDGKPTAYWPIGYPAALSLIFRIAGPSMVAAKSFNVFLSCGILVFAYQIAQKIFQSEVVATMTLFILAIHPNHIAYVSLLASEPLFLFLFLLGTSLFLSDWKLGAALSGLAFGCACLVKPLAILAPLVFLLTPRGQNGQGHRRSAAARVMIAYAFLVLALLPWLIRNYVVMGGPMFISTNGGSNLLIGNHADAPGNYWLPPTINQEKQKIQEERDLDSRLTKLATAYIWSHPVRTVKLWFVKAWYLYRSDVEGWSWIALGCPIPCMPSSALWIIKSVSQIFYSLTVLLFLAFFVLQTKRFGWACLASLPLLGLYMIVYFTGIYIICFGGSRFHFPVFPWISMYAAACLDLSLYKTRRFSAHLPQSSNSALTT